MGPTGNYDIRSRFHVNLKPCSAQAIYNHALSAAKISKVVENISDVSNPNHQFGYTSRAAYEILHTDVRDFVRR